MEITAPLLEELSKSAREAFPYLRALADTNLGVNAILSQLREAGFSINTQKGGDLIALLRDKADFSRFVRAFGENAILPESLHKISPLRFSEGAHFQYQVELTSENELVPEAIYVNSEGPLSATQIFGAASSMIGGDSPQLRDIANSDITQMDITDARWSPGTPF